MEQLNNNPTSKLPSWEQVTFVAFEQSSFELHWRLLVSPFHRGVHALTTYKDPYAANIHN